MDQIKARFIPEASSADPEKAIMYIARVSNPKNQDSQNTGLLRYCIENAHWSVFEQSSMTIEIECPLWLATQILRHRSFCFQQFSHRYAEAELEVFQQQARSQDAKNRQNSNDDLPKYVQDSWELGMNMAAHSAFAAYERALEMGVAKECARNILPTGVMTRMYMTGSVRSWIHYLQLRTGNGTQKEHIYLAEQIKQIFKEKLPVCSKALGW